MVNLVLTRAGYSVLLAADGQEALQLSRGYIGVIDLLLSDVMMPRLDGVQLVSRLRLERPQTKALLISGKMSSEIVAGNSAFHFLRKPFLPAQLLGKIVDTLQSDSNAVEKI